MFHRRPFPAIILSALLLPVQAHGLQEIRVGQIIGNEHVQTINGWTHESGGFWGETAAGECCFIIFRRGNDILVARGEPVARGSRGGVEAERIMATRIVRQEEGEIEGHCFFLSLSAAIAFYNPSTRVVRGVFVDREGIEIRRWLLDDEDSCSFGD